MKARVNKSSMAEKLEPWLKYMDWDSLYEIVTHYQDYNNHPHKRKLPPLTKEIVSDLDAVLTLFWAATTGNPDPKGESDFLSEIENRKMLHRLGSYLKKNVNISKITLSGNKGSLPIDDKFLIRLMLDAISPTIMIHAQKPKTGAPSTKLWNVIAVRASIINELKRKGITNEFLFESFKRINEKETPSLESFVKTLSRALKAGQKYL